MSPPLPFSFTSQGIMIQPVPSIDVSGVSVTTSEKQQVHKMDNEHLEPPLEKINSNDSGNSTRSFTVEHEFIKPNEYEINFPWRKVGSFIDPNDEIDESLLKDLALDDSSKKISTYIYEKYYADFYWNCSLIISCCFFSWFISFIGFGIFSYVFVAICTFAVYRAEFRRFNTNIRDDFQRIQSVENLENKLESMEWLNNFLAKFWIIYMPALSDLVITNTNQTLANVEPPTPIKKVSLDEFTMGTKAPKIDSIQSFTKLGKDLYQMDWKFNFTPNDISDMTQNELKNKIDPKVALGIKIGKGFVGASLPILLENMSMIGNLRIKIKLGEVFPHIDVLSVCFMEPPTIDYALKPVGGNTLGIDVMSIIPGLSSFVTKLINSNLEPLMYYPNTIDIKPADFLQPESAAGCLFIKIRGVEYISKDNTSNLYVKYGPENELDKTFTTDIKSNTVVPVYNETQHILINNLNSKIKFELFNLIKNGDSLSIGESFFELQDLLQDPSMELNESKIIKNNKNVGKIVYDLKWFSVLKPETLADGTLSSEIPDSDVGILNLNILSAIDLDLTKSLIGKLSSFIEIYLDNQLIQTSRVVKGSNTPEYNLQFEHLISTKSTSFIKIVIKDTSSFDESIIAEYQGKILDLILGNTSSVNVKDQHKNEQEKNFTEGKGSFKFSITWKPLDSSITKLITGNEDTLSFTPPIGAVKIDLKSCKDLPNLENFGKIDPYIKIYSGGEVKGVTSVEENTTDPVFNDEFFISIYSKNQMIKIEVMDKQKNKQDRLIGTLDVKLDEFFKNKEKQNKIFKFDNCQLSKNRAKAGLINYQISYYPLLPIYSHNELQMIEMKKKEIHEKSEDLDELEEQAKFLEDYKKHPDDYEWVDIDEDVKDVVIDDKLVVSLDDLIKVNSGVIGINFISGKLNEKTAFVQFFIDDHNTYDFITRKSKNGKIGSSSGQVFVRDLKHSILNIMITKTMDVKQQSDVLYETSDSFKLIELLMAGYDNAIEIDLDGNKLNVLFEYVPVIDHESNLFDTFEDTGLLKLNLIGAKNLLSADTNGKSDPFILGYVDGKKVFKTKVKKKTLNPEFDEIFTVPIRSRKRQEIELKVYDWDMAGSNDYLGSTIIKLNDNEEDKVIESSLETQGSIIYKYDFTVGYIKPNSSVLIPVEEDSTLSQTMNMLNYAPTVGIDAVGKAGNLAGGLASNAVGGATGIVSGGVTGGMNKISEIENGALKKLIHKDGEDAGFGSHLKLKPPGFLHKSRKSIDEDRTLKSKKSISTMNDDNRSRHLRVPSSPGINNNNKNTSFDAQSRGRSSIDAVSVNTNAFNGSNSITGRLTIIEMKGITSVEDTVFIKVTMVSSNGTEKVIFKTRKYKIKDGHVKWNENVLFKCDTEGKIVFTLATHHTFGKGDEIASGEILLRDVSGIRDNVVINMNIGNLIVNFNYA